MSASEARDWADAFRAQAREDLKAATHLQGAAPSVLAMLLQMVFEKLGKAALLRSGQISLDKARSSHAAGSRMIATLKRNRRLLEALGGGSAFAWKDVLPLVTELERAHPQLANGAPQLEYPWSDAASSRVCWPARDLPVALRFGAPTSTEAARLLRFAAHLDERLDTIFP